jgi:hypothetical protein
MIKPNGHTCCSHMNLFFQIRRTTLSNQTIIGGAMVRGSISSRIKPMAIKSVFAASPLNT